MVIELSRRLSAGTQVRFVKNSQWSLVLLLITLRGEAADTYRLDSSNTQVAFAVQHLGIQWMSARFSDISGEFVLDQAGPKSRVDVTVGTASLDSNQPHWNERLRSAEWLDVERYPQMIYHSRSIEIAAARGVADGELTLHGVTRPIVLAVSLTNCGSQGSCQFTAHGRIRRSEFGLPHGFWSGGDQVEISINGTIETPAGRAPIGRAPISTSRRPSVAG
jgi:polyisoprenoid-binding protein YceI